MKVSRAIVILYLCAFNIDSESKEVPVLFETSLGCMDTYMEKFYGKLLIKLNRPFSKWGRHLKPHSAHTALSLFKSLYTKHETTVKNMTGIPKIPKIIHQIWIGPLPRPEKYKRWQTTWQTLPGWSYKLWTDEDVADLQLTNSDIYYKEKNYGARADILRIEILNQIGGVYVDMD